MGATWPSGPRGEGSLSAPGRSSSPTPRVASSRRVPGAGWLVAWAPDSARFATWVELGETIGVYGLDGTRHALLTVPPGLMAAGDFDPVWSPDGNALVVPSGVLVPLDGSQPVLLPRSDPRSDRVSAFSPDGTRAVFRGPDRSLILAAADGSGARRLLDPAESYSHLVWSPTGDHFAYAASRGTSTTVWVMDPVSGEIVRTVGIDGAGMWAFPIRFSPDGRSLLVGTLEDGGGEIIGNRRNRWHRLHGAAWPAPTLATGSHRWLVTRSQPCPPSSPGLLWPRSRTRPRERRRVSDGSRRCPPILSRDNSRMPCRVSSTRR